MFKNTIQQQQSALPAALSSECCIAALNTSAASKILQMYFSTVL
jgi:hypothetical protein